MLHGARACAARAGRGVCHHTNTRLQRGCASARGGCLCGQGHGRPGADPPPVRPPVSGSTRHCHQNTDVWALRAVTSRYSTTPQPPPLSVWYVRVCVSSPDSGNECGSVGGRWVRKGAPPPSRSTSSTHSSTPVYSALSPPPLNARVARADAVPLGGLAHGVRAGAADATLGHASLMLVMALDPSWCDVAEAVAGAVCGAPGGRRGPRRGGGGSSPTALVATWQVPGAAASQRWPGPPQPRG